ncbi:MAG: TlpA family protein disulfide reductase [Byssovorax sp.]
MAHRSLALVALVLLAGCTRSEPPAVREVILAPSATAETKAPEASIWIRIEAAPAGGLPARLKAEIGKAVQKKLKPVVYIGATWCKPCVAIKKYKKDPLMLDALEGTYVIDLDLDDWKAPDLTALGFNAGEVPHFYLVDGEGRSTGRTITSSVWKEDIPVNMAPKLKAFFSG